jgi:transmembrane sensor
MQKDMSVIETAAYWATCLEDDALSQTEREDLAHWLRKSPEHVKELLLAQAILTDAAGIDPDRETDVEALLADLDRNIVHFGTRVSTGRAATGQASSGRSSASTSPGPAAHIHRPATRAYGMALFLRAPHGLAAMAASLLLIAAALVIFNNPFSPATQLYATGVGEQRSLSLADGSVVHLNTQSEVRVSYTEGERDIYLLRGEALFDVAHNQERPFRVHVDSTVAQALGTSFNVYRKGDETEVAVLEGTVAISWRDAADNSSTVGTSKRQAGASAAPEVLATLTQGQEASVAATGAVITHEVADLDKITYWRQRKIVFEDTPVSEIVREFNRYNTVQIVVEGVGGSEPLFSGVFDVDKPDAFIKTLEASGATVRRSAGQNRVFVNFSAFRSKGGTAAQLDQGHPLRRAHARRRCSSLWGNRYRLPQSPKDAQPVL